MLIFALADYF